MALSYPARLILHIQHSEHPLERKKRNSPSPHPHKTQKSILKSPFLRQRLTSTPDNAATSAAAPAACCTELHPHPQPWCWGGQRCPSCPVGISRRNGSVPHRAHALCLAFPNWEGFQPAVPRLVCADVLGRSAAVPGSSPRYLVQRASAQHQHSTSAGPGCRRCHRFTSQTPFSGAAKAAGAARVSSAPTPRTLFRKRSQLVEEVFMAGDQSPWRLPSFPVFSCCTARVCSWVCGPLPRRGGGGEGAKPRACTGRKARPSQRQDAGVSLLASPMAVPTAGHPRAAQKRGSSTLPGGQGELGLLGKGAGGEWDSQASMAKGMQLFLAQRQRHCLQVLQAFQLVRTCPVWAISASPREIILLSPSCSISTGPGLAPGLHCSQVLS